MAAIGIGIVWLLALIGTTWVVEWLGGRLFRPPEEAVVLLPLSGHREDVEYCLHTALDGCRRAGFAHIRVVDEGMDEDTRRLAEAACRRMGVELV